LRANVDFRELTRHDIKLPDRTISVSSKMFWEDVKRQIISNGMATEKELDDERVDIISYPTPVKESNFKWQKGPISKDAKTTSTKPQEKQ
jgi:hypothetical protein